MTCSRCSGGALHKTWCPELETKLRTMLVIVVSTGALVTLVNVLGGPLQLRFDLAVMILALVSAAWLFVRRAVRRGSSSD